MTQIKYILKSLFFYRRLHFITLLGTIVSAGIITGALIIGDSVTGSLQKIVSARLGNSEFVISSAGRFFRAELANELSGSLAVETAPVLLLKGIASLPAGNKKVQNIQVCGIDQRFGMFWPSKSNINSIAEDEIIINRKLAAELDIKVQDELLLRIEKTRLIPLDAPFVPDNPNFITRRLKVAAIISGNEFGNFNLQNNQVAPFNIFMSRKSLTKIMATGDLANLILVGKNDDVTESRINSTINEVWQLSDLGLKFRKVPGLGTVEMISDRIFIDGTLDSIVKSADTSSAPVFTYLANGIKCKPNETPYSFVAALSNGFPGNLKENEIAINEWTAADLNAKPGDTIELSYYITGNLRQLTEEKASFILKEIIPQKGIAADKMLMPEFEGLAHVDQCRDWAAGVPVDYKKIRKKDEDYWKEFRGTPKAFISFKTAVQIWGNRFGACTAIRFNPAADTCAISRWVLHNLQPGQAALNVIPVKKAGIWSAAGGVDFGQLFLGLSFFLLIASLILSGLLFSLQIGARENEIGILSALGLHRAQIKKLLFIEGMIIAFSGSLLGIIAGIFFDKALMIFLNSVWNDIVRTPSIEICVKPLTVIIGTITSFVFASLVMILAVRKKMEFSLAGLLQKNLIYTKTNSRRKSPVSLVIFIICFVSVPAWLLFMPTGYETQNPGIFFITGALALAGIIALFDFLLVKIRKSHSGKISFLRLGIKNIVYKRKRSLAMFSLFSTGTFLLVSVGINRTDFKLTAMNRQSGSGGFAFFGETTLPVLYDLNSKQGREKYSLEKLPDGVSFVQMRTLAGDDASCLNLNRVSKPRIIGVDPECFGSRNAFSFDRTDQSIGESNPWRALKEPLGKNIFPAIADQTVIQWSMGKSIGDTLEYANEKGDTIWLKLIAGLSGSIFQGNIIISEKIFMKNFPSVSGSNIILADVPSEKCAAVKEILSDAFQNEGIVLSSTSERLAGFNSVTNTYLDIFLSLGFLALLISVVGVAIMIVRSIADRRHELAMMRALGIKRISLVKNLAVENLAMLVCGTTAGLLSSLAATYPALASGEPHLSYKFLLILIAILLLNGTAWIFLASGLSLKKAFLEDLRNE